MQCITRLNMVRKRKRFRILPLIPPWWTARCLWRGTEAIQATEVIQATVAITHHQVGVGIIRRIPHRRTLRRRRHRMARRPLHPLLLLRKIHRKQLLQQLRLVIMTSRWYPVFRQSLNQRGTIRGLLTACTVYRRSAQFYFFRSNTAWQPSAYRHRICCPTWIGTDFLVRKRSEFGRKFQIKHPGGVVPAGVSCILPSLVGVLTRLPSSRSWPNCRAGPRCG